MRTLSTILESAHLNEAEKATQLLADKDIGLMIHKGDSGQRIFILFRISEFVDTVKAMVRYYADKETGIWKRPPIKPETLLGMFSHLERYAGTYVLAILIAGVADPDDEYGPCWDASTIEMTAAEKGYGPAVYEIGLAVIGSLIPDRAAVSASAKGVWGKFLKRADIEARPLDNIKVPETPDPQDDCKVYFNTSDGRTMVDYAYKLTDGSRQTILNSVVPALLKRKDDAFRELNFTMPDYVAERILRAYFWPKYGG